MREGERERERETDRERAREREAESESAASECERERGGGGANHQIEAFSATTTPVRLKALKAARATCINQAGYRAKGSDASGLRFR